MFGSAEEAYRNRSGLSFTN